MTKFAKVTDRDDLIRDMDSKAVLNIDTEALFNHRRKKYTMKTIMNQGDRINKVEDDIKEIKSLLLQLLNKD